MDESYAVFCVFILGLVIGSFLNVCIYRIPRGESVVFSASRCTVCNCRLGLRDLMPVISFLLLLGHCRKCGSRINKRYPFVEALTGFLFAAGYTRLGFQPILIKAFFFFSIMIILSFIDLEHYIVPNELVLAGLAGGAIFLFVDKDISCRSALLGAASSAGFLFSLMVISRGGMGYGDVKLAAVVGIFLGWPLGLLSVFISCCLAGVTGIILVLSRKMKLKDMMPFVPYMALGSCITTLWGGELLAGCTFF